MNTSTASWFPSGGAITCGTGAILLVAAQAMMTGSFSVGDFALFVAYLGTVGEVIRTVGAVLAGAKQTTVSLARLAALLLGRRRLSCCAPPRCTCTASRRPCSRPSWCRTMTCSNWR